MNEGALHAMNPMSELLLEGVAQVQMSSLGTEYSRQFGNVNVDHVLVGPSIRRANSTVLTNEIRRCTAPAELWLSTAIIQWSRQAEVEYLPIVFGGELTKHVSLSLRNVGVNPKPTAVR
jgi:hypothetical protein